MKIITSFILLMLVLTSYISAQGTRLLRQPTISSESIVFVYANDLWKVNREGGDAIRLTTNEGAESNPHFSNDEKWIAFSAQYDGNTDVYLIPAEGGSPKRLTWHPGADIVQGWTPDGKVMFRSGREARPTQTSKFFYSFYRWRIAKSTRNSLVPHLANFRLTENKLPTSLLLSGILSGAIIVVGRQCRSGLSTWLPKS